MRYLGWPGSSGPSLLLRLGLPPLMRSPERRSTAYTTTVTAIAVLLALLMLLMPSCATTASRGRRRRCRRRARPGGLGKAAPAGGKGKRTSSPDERLVGADKQGSGALNLDDLPKESIREMIDRTVDPKKMRELEEAARIAAETAGKIPFKPAEPSMLGELVPAVACGQPRQLLEAKLARFPQGRGSPRRWRASVSRGAACQVRMEIGDNSPRAGGMTQLRKLMPDQSQTTTRGYQRRRSEGDVYIDERWDAPRPRGVLRRAHRRPVRRASPSPPASTRRAAPNRRSRSVDWAKLAAMAQAPVR